MRARAFRLVGRWLQLRSHKGRLPVKEPLTCGANGYQRLGCPLMRADASHCADTITHHGHVHPCRAVSVAAGATDARILRARAPFVAAVLRLNRPHVSSKPGRIMMGARLCNPIIECASSAMLQMCIVCAGFWICKFGLPLPRLTMMMHVSRH